MVYLERRPHPVLAPYIKSFWYTYDPTAIHARQRVLPGGHMQVVISLARDYLTDCDSTQDGPGIPSAAAVLVGMYTRAQVIDCFDMAELIGVVFQPGGSVAFFPAESHVFTNIETSLEAIWGQKSERLRDRLRELPSVENKFEVLEQEFLRRLPAGYSPKTPPALSLALEELGRSDGRVTVAEISRRTGVSSRWVSQLFREHVGISPKQYARIRRFQRALQQMQAGAEVHWAELALDCGYYDQAHFIHDFRDFSGISPTTYCAAHPLWRNHVPLE